MSDQVYPNDPKNMVIRPLTKGMMRHLAANQIPNEAAWTLQDMGVFRGGVQTRPRYTQVVDGREARGGSIASPDISFVMGDWTPSGTARVKNQRYFLQSEDGGSTFDFQTPNVAVNNTDAPYLISYVAFENLVATNVLVKLVTEDSGGTPTSTITNTHTATGYRTGTTSASGSTTQAHLEITITGYTSGSCKIGLALGRVGDTLLTENFLFTDNTTDWSGDGFSFVTYSRPSGTTIYSQADITDILEEEPPAFAVLLQDADTIESDIFPVPPSKTFTIFTGAWSQGGSTWSLDIEWFDTAGSTISTSAVPVLAGSSLTQFLRVTGIVTSPSTTASAKIIISPDVANNVLILLKAGIAYYSLEDSLRTVFLHWEDVENFQTIALGDNFLYEVRGKFLYRIPIGSAYSAIGTVSLSSGTTYTVASLSSNPVTAGIAVGDLGWYDGYPFEVVSVDSSTQITILDTTGMFPGIVGSGAIRIEKSLLGGDIYPVQYARSAGNTGQTYLSSANKRPLLKYTISGGLEELDLFPIAGTSVTEIRAVEVIGNRIFIGNFNEDGTIRTNRIRWGKSYPADMEVFDDGDAGYLDFLEARTGLIRLKSLGKMLIAYFGDQIYYGQPTSIAGLPYAFTKMDSGDIGLAGPRALAEWIDGHFFVGQDDIYFFSPSGPPQPIGTPVIKQTIQVYKDYLHRAQAIPDPRRDRILFIFPDSSGTAQEVWAFNYKDQAWSYENVPAQGLGFTAVTTINRIDSYSPVYIDPDTYDPDDYPDAPAGSRIDDFTDSFDDYKSSYSQRRLFLIHDNNLYRVIDSDSASCELATINPVYESGDIDFGAPDQIKTVNRLNIKLENVWEQTLTTIDPDTLEATNEEDATMVWRVEYSLNRGRTWENVGNLLIEAGSDEGKVNFLATGSLFRFRLTLTSRAKPVKIVEVGLRAKQRATEVTYG